MLVKVRNRSNGRSAYTLSQYKDRANLRREFAPGETLEIDLEELEALTYVPGGKILLTEYLQVLDRDAIEKLQLTVEPEYDMSKDDIINLLQYGTMDAFLDCLDFAPSGVLDLIKELAVDLPLNDSAKRKAIKDKLGLDVDLAIRNNEESKSEEKPQPKKERRVATEEKESGRRTATPNYKVVTKKDDELQ